MATIPGSHYLVTAPGQPVNIVETTTGLDLPPTVPGAFNLEVFIGSIAGMPSIAAGYQGLAILSPSGHELDLISGAFAATDQGVGDDTLSAYGANETVDGGSAIAALNLFGSAETARGGSGADTINVLGNNDLAIGGTGSDTINVAGSFDTVDGGSDDLINLIGSSSQINQGTGLDTINVVGSDDTVSAGAQAGTNEGLVNFLGGNMIFADAGNQFTDTVVGFDQAAGDRIHLTSDTVANALAHSAQVNGGADTLITLTDGSTILLKGVSHIDTGFFA